MYKRVTKQLYNAFIQSKLSAYNSMYSVRAAAVQTQNMFAICSGGKNSRKLYLNTIGYITDVFNDKLLILK